MRRSPGGARRCCRFDHPPRSPGLGQNNAALMRGHGCIVVGRTLREAVCTAVCRRRGCRSYN
ncbi:class II aldolase/adducin family protein [Paraburkholderia sp. WSM4174]|uniref:class II aldolase/adducin family protein n=1 Tax=Paraburkholderia TaxID=1822464 RepID=UPI003D1AFBC0